MNHIIKSLSKILVITMMCGYTVHGFSDTAADNGSSGSGDTRLQTNLNSDRQTASGRLICGRGQYVAKCGNYDVGFNWLKGTVLTFVTSQNACENTWSGIWDSGVCTSKNYYYTDDESELLKQMRNFFGNPSDNASINYCSNWNNNSDSCASIGIASNIKNARNAILNTVCNPLDISVQITCARCPNSANIASSTVDTGASINPELFTWNFHTIADCYINTFTDTNGTYKYVNENGTNTAKQPCYYTPDDSSLLDTLQGDDLPM